MDKALHRHLRTDNTMAKINWTKHHGCLWASCCSMSNFLCNFLLFVVGLFVIFYIALVLSVVLKFMASHYLFGIFNLFYRNYHSPLFLDIRSNMIYIQTRYCWKPCPQERQHIFHEERKDI
jgi:hypothetical protein